MRKVLITDDVHPMITAGLEKAGYECVYLPDITHQEVLDCIASFEGLIINSKIFVNRELLDRAGSLRFVGRVGSGMEIVDREYARQKGVAVFSSPEGNRNAVAEQALGMLLALANNLIRADREVRKKVWEREKNRGFEIMGKTIGIVGFGNTGSTFARKLAGMDVQVLAYDKYKTHYARAFPYVTETDFDTLTTQSDIISFHLPLTAETRHLVNAGWIQRCKDGFVLINTSRGPVVKTDDLIDALESGKISGACLDVFENEKPGAFTPAENELYERLYRLDNVVLSPHIAGWTHESKLRLAEVLLHKMSEVL